MPRFTILPLNPPDTLAEITALSPEAVLHIVGELNCGEADVLRDGDYSFSVRLDTNGLWSIFQRDVDPNASNVVSFA